MAKGHDYELQVTNAISRSTDQTVACLRPDYSGNSKFAVGDIVVLHENDLHVHADYVELKKRQADGGRRTTVMEGSSDGDSGLDELQGLCDDVPPWAVPWVAVKFTRRKLAVFKADDLRRTLENDDVGVAPFQARLTPSDNISMRKPTLDEWPSATASPADYYVLLDELGVPIEE
jgi:Holliday junction resolvase